MTPSVGISGMAVYVPPYRVNLRDWAEWTGNSWEKISAVVGHSFRMRGPTENVYTMAAAAVLRLIEQYEIDPEKVRYLALGTESSTDNSAGAVVVKGLVNRALVAQGKDPITRYCEVPEYKHACLGGVYGIKNAARFLALEHSDSVAIVVSSDVAEYSRGSSGEPTQGAGAVAVLLEKDPRLLELQLQFAGSASDYREVDFRKPLARIVGERQRIHGQIRDFPVFNGKFSTSCYLDASLHAVRDMLNRRTRYAAGYLRQLRAAFFHRPYRRMPENALLLIYLLNLANGSRADREEFARIAESTGIDPAEAGRELRETPDLESLVRERKLSAEIYPAAMPVVKAFRKSEAGQEMLERCFGLGAEKMMDIGNLYTAALPAWVAAGMEDALERSVDLDEAEILLMGYGSGDAAEAIPARVALEWRVAAKKIGFSKALEGGIDLTQAQYADLHDHGEAEGLKSSPRQLFELERIGGQRDGDFADFGVEYYRLAEALRGDAQAPIRQSG
ncbi:MAG: hypothetical protein R3200_03640 [Xanthomonadales bacterium]|nr:hypothetical protein [Xanthomonadales bacterium]